jgi:hypothetical protein
MWSSEIECFLFGQFGTHALVGLSLCVNRVEVAVAPWIDLACITEAVFENALLMSFSAACRDEPLGEIAFPWDIIDFSSTKQTGGQWKFVLYCGNSVELVFLADFPHPERG